MIKYACSQDIPVDVGAGLELHEDPTLCKQASGTIFGMTYDELRPDNDHVGIHAVALGESERFGPNRNYDGWPRAACQKYHDTFVKDGAVFKNHVNKDKAKSLGKIAASAYNEDMGRIELYLHVDKDRARDELHNLAKNGTHDFSMAATVPFDTCSTCGTLRKSAADPNQCDHIKYKFGQMEKDGSYHYVENPICKWFDMSFVKRGADRIARDLVVTLTQDKTASLWVPEGYTDGMLEKRAWALRIREYERELVEALSLGTNSSLLGMAKAAADDLPDEALFAIRDQRPDDIFYALAAEEIVLPPGAFLKYALGPGQVEKYDGLIQMAKAGLFTRIFDRGSDDEVCSNEYFDLDTEKAACYISGSCQKIVSGFSDAVSFDDEAVYQRAAIKAASGDTAAHRPVVDTFDPACERVADWYGAYKLSAIKAIRDTNPGVSMKKVLALSAAQGIM